MANQISLGDRCVKHQFPLLSPTIKYFMSDSIFREWSFLFSGRYNKSEARKLAANGLFNGRMYGGNRVDFYHIACAFCKFTFSKTRTKASPILGGQEGYLNSLNKINVFQLKLVHAKRFPNCTMVMSRSGLDHKQFKSDNIIFNDVVDVFGFSSSKYNPNFNPDYPFAGTRIRLMDLTPREQTKESLLRCLCYAHVRDVYLLNCKHLVCQHYLTVISSPVTYGEEHKCPYCRASITYYSKVLLPEALPVGDKI
jgi:hypothetical protein